MKNSQILKSKIVVLCMTQNQFRLWDFLRGADDVKHELVQEPSESSFSFCEFPIVSN